MAGSPDGRLPGPAPPWVGPAGIACLDAERRRLVLTVAIDHPPVLELSLDHPDPQRSPRWNASPPCATSRRSRRRRAWPSCSSIEPLGTRFFRQFRRTFEGFQGAMPAGPSAGDRNALALLQLTRVLFLYFVQSKGWLDGRADFLARAVDDCLVRRRPLHRDLLRPLFFGALNRPFTQRGAIARRFGKLPFLNGGLFEPHALERRWKVDVPTQAWRDAFDSLFEGFHFTTREGDGSVVAPDMLGRVFEGLMDPEQRHRSGTYYTPASLVQRLVDSALAIHREHSGVPLADVTLLDPAVGSGAFLLGALEHIAQLTQQPHESAAAARRRVSLPATSSASILIPPRCGSPSCGSGSPSSPMTTPPIPPPCPRFPTSMPWCARAIPSGAGRDCIAPTRPAPRNCAARATRRSPPPGGAQASRIAGASAGRGIGRGFVAGTVHRGGRGAHRRAAGACAH